MNGVNGYYQSLKGVKYLENLIGGVCGHVSFFLSNFLLQSYLFFLYFILAIDNNVPLAIVLHFNGGLKNKSNMDNWRVKGTQLNLPKEFTGETWTLEFPIDDSFHRLNFSVKSQDSINFS